MSDADVRNLGTTALFGAMLLTLAFVFTIRRQFKASEATMSDESDDSNPGSVPCDSCTRIHRSVKTDPGTRMQLCNECWASYKPKYVTTDEAKRQGIERG